MTLKDSETGGHTPLETQTADAAEGAGGDHPPLDIHLTPVPAAADTIRALHRMRIFATRQQIRLNNGLAAHVRVNVLGWSPALPEQEREAIRRKAKVLLKVLRSGAVPLDHDADTIASVTALMHATGAATEPFDALRKEAETALRQHVRALPVWPWCAGVSGLAEIGVSSIIGEAGDLDNYDGPAKLWKQLGWAPADTYPQGANGGRIIPRRRKGQVWGDVVKPLITSQGFDGPYRRVYDRRRLRTASSHGDWSKLHSHRDASRVMLKALLRDFWLVWHGRDPVLDRPATP